MKVIHKYRLSSTSHTQRIHLPKGAFVVMVGQQLGSLYFWAEFERSETRMEARDFFVHGTGHDIPEDQIWVGSTQVEPFVWHVYEAAR